jgi:hypothetical protein
MVCRLLLLAVVPAAAGIIPESLASRLPRIEARTLDGRLVVLPDSALGRTTLVGFAYRRELADDLSRWSTEFARRHADTSTFHGYEVPMMGSRIPGIVRGIINSSMRRTVPRERHRWYAPFYGDAGQYAAAMGVADRSVVHVALLDRNGLVRWRFKGEPTDAALADLAAAVAELRSAAPPTPPLK